MRKAIYYPIRFCRTYCGVLVLKYCQCLPENLPFLSETNKVSYAPIILNQTLQNLIEKNLPIRLDYIVRKCVRV